MKCISTIYMQKLCIQNTLRFVNLKKFENTLQIQNMSDPTTLTTLMPRTHSARLSAGTNLGLGDET